MSYTADFTVGVRSSHDKEVAEGLHDGQCEFHPAGFYLCHCSRRRREAAGVTGPAERLIFQDPICPTCLVEVDFDGDGGFDCPKCRSSFNGDGTWDSYSDDYGDLLKMRAEWLAAQAGKATL